MATPSIALSANIRISDAKTDLDPVYYKRGMNCQAELGKHTATTMSPVYYKRGLASRIKGAESSASMTAMVKRTLSSGIELGRMRATGGVAIRQTIGANLSIGSAKTRYKAAKKTTIGANLKATNSFATIDGRVAHNTSANVTLGRAVATLQRLHRKIVPPPPSFSVVVQTATGDVPLQGATLYAGSSYRLNLRGRGYYLGTLNLARGPQLLFRVSTGLGGNRDIVFAKSTHQPLSGIGIDEVNTLSVTEHGTLEEIHGQIRIYPHDTASALTGRSQNTMYWELQMVDPLSERPEPLRGTFNLVP